MDKALQEKLIRLLRHAPVAGNPARQLAVKAALERLRK